MSYREFEHRVREAELRSAAARWRRIREAQRPAESGARTGGRVVGTGAAARLRSLIRPWAA